MYRIFLCLFTGQSIGGKHEHTHTHHIWGASSFQESKKYQSMSWMSWVMINLLIWPIWFWTVGETQLEVLSNETGRCSTPIQLLICSSFSRENAHHLLVCSSLSMILWKYWQLPSLQWLYRWDGPYRIVDLIETKHGRSHPGHSVTPPDWGRSLPNDQSLPHSDQHASKLWLSLPHQQMRALNQIKHKQNKGQAGSVTKLQL